MYKAKALGEQRERVDEDVRSLKRARAGDDALRYTANFFAWHPAEAAAVKADHDKFHTAAAPELWAMYAADPSIAGNPPGDGVQREWLFKPQSVFVSGDPSGVHARYWQLGTYAKRLVTDKSSDGMAGMFERALAPRDDEFENLSIQVQSAAIWGCSIAADGARHPHVRNHKHADLTEKHAIGVDLLPFQLYYRADVRKIIGKFSDGTINKLRAYHSTIFASVESVLGTGGMPEVSWDMGHVTHDAHTGKLRGIMDCYRVPRAFLVPHPCSWIDMSSVCGRERIMSAAASYDFLIQHVTGDQFARNTFCADFLAKNGAAIDAVAAARRKCSEAGGAVVKEAFKEQPSARTDAQTSIVDKVEAGGARGRARGNATIKKAFKEQPSARTKAQTSTVDKMKAGLARGRATVKKAFKEQPSARTKAQTSIVDKMKAGLARGGARGNTTVKKAFKEQPGARTDAQTSIVDKMGGTRTRGKQAATMAAKPFGEPWKDKVDAALPPGYGWTPVKEIENIKEQHSALYNEVASLAGGTSTWACQDGVPGAAYVFVKSRRYVRERSAKRADARGAKRGKYEDDDTEPDTEHDDDSDDSETGTEHQMVVGSDDDDDEDEASPPACYEMPTCSLQSLGAPEE
eukprot:g5648.t1